MVQDSPTPTLASAGVETIPPAYSFSYSMIVPSTERRVNSGRLESSLLISMARIPSGSTVTDDWRVSLSA